MDAGWVVVLRDSPRFTFQVLDESRCVRKRPRLWYVARLLGGRVLKRMTIGLYETT